MSSTADFVDWFFWIIASLSELELGTFAMVMYNVWSQKNNKLWNGTCLPTDVAMLNTLSNLCSWLAKTSFWLCQM